MPARIDWVKERLIPRLFGRNSTATAPGNAFRFRGRWRLGEKSIEGLISLSGILAIVLLLGVLVLLLKEGLPIFSHTPPWEFFFGTKWYPISEPPTFGVMPFFVSTIMITAIATAVAVPI